MIRYLPKILIFNLLIYILCTKAKCVFDTENCIVGWSLFFIFHFFQITPPKKVQLLTKTIHKKFRANSLILTRAAKALKL